MQPWDMSPAAALYSPTAGMMAGFALAGVTVILSLHRRTERTKRALSLLMSSCMGLTLASFLYAEIVGDAGVLKKQDAGPRQSSDKSQHANRYPPVEDSETAVKGAPESASDDVQTRVRRVNVLNFCAGMILGICAIQLFGALRVLLSEVGLGGPFQVGGLCHRVCQLLVVQQVGLLLLAGAGAVSAYLPVRTAVGFSIAALIAAAVLALPRRPLRGLKQRVLALFAEQSAAGVTVLLGVLGMLCTFVLYIHPHDLSETMARALIWVIALVAFVAICLAEAALYVPDHPGDNRSRSPRPPTRTGCGC